MKHVAYLGIGSNIDAFANIQVGLDVLADSFELFIVSSLVESAAVGFDGDPFLNLVAGIRTNRSIIGLTKILRRIEFAHGRIPGCTKFSPRTLDIDLLTYNDRVGLCYGIELPRAEIVENAFVLGPFAEIAPGLVLPTGRDSLSALWAAHPGQHTLNRVDFCWRGCRLPYQSRATNLANFS